MMKKYSSYTILLNYVYFLEIHIEIDSVCIILLWKSIVHVAFLKKEYYVVHFEFCIYLKSK